MPPNFVFITTGTQAADFIGCYGRSELRWERRAWRSLRTQGFKGASRMKPADDDSPMLRVSPPGHSAESGAPT